MTLADHDSAATAPAYLGSNGHQAVLAGAERLLADTADTITPGTGDWRPRVVRGQVALRPVVMSRFGGLWLLRLWRRGRRR
jgi:hypothetical protein